MIGDFGESVTLSHGVHADIGLLNRCHGRDAQALARPDGVAADAVCGSKDGRRHPVPARDGSERLACLHGMNDMLGTTVRAHGADRRTLDVGHRQDQALANAQVLRTQAVGLNDGLLRDVPATSDARERVSLSHAVGHATPGGERRQAELCIGCLGRNVRLIICVRPHKKRGVGEHATALRNAVHIPKLVLGHPCSFGD